MTKSTRIPFHAVVRAGARVLTLGHDDDPLNEARDAARAEGGELHGITADLARREDVGCIFAEGDAKPGGLDILVPNAARGALERLDRGGQIVIIGSIRADIHAPGESVYSATKAGLQASAETLRNEVEERGVRVSLVEPDSVGSDMPQSSPSEQRDRIAQEGMLRADDIAETVEFILTLPRRVDVVGLRIEPRIEGLA